MTLDAPPPPSTMRRDIVSAYAASGLKVLSWAVAAALIYRFNVQYFAVFALIRGTLSVLNYTTLGLAPAIIRLLNVATREAAADRLVVSEAPDRADPSSAGPNVLNYADTDLRSVQADPLRQSKQVVFSALLLAVGIGVLSAVVAGVLANNVDFIDAQTHAWLAQQTRRIALLLGIGLAMRLASDVCGAILQAFGHISADNFVLTFGDVVWISVMVWQALTLNRFTAHDAATAFALSSAALLLVRVATMTFLVGPWMPRPGYFSLRTIGQLLGFGMMVSLAQLADLLYAPVDYWLIRKLISLETITTYAPAVQIDAAMFLLIGGLASVLLPKSAAAHVKGNLDALRLYYVRGTLASLAMLTAAAVVVWAGSPWLFRLWLGDPMPATQAILPLLLVSTVLGGASAVGRSILLGMGKVWPFTVAALVAGVANVALSLLFVAGFGWGLKGVVLGTVVAVVARCAFWQPWYVLRCLKRV